MEWKAPAAGAKDPVGEREESELYADLSDSLRTWARSYHAEPAQQADTELEADRGREAGE